MSAPANSAARFEEVVAQILCYGVRPSERCLKAWGEVAPLDTDFIHGIPLHVGHAIVNTALYGGGSVQMPLACEIDYQDGRSYAVARDGTLIDVRPVRQPPAVWATDTQGRTIGDYLRLHSPNTAFAVPVRECVFGAIGKACQFCTYRMLPPKPLAPREFGNLFRLFYDAAPSVTSVAFGGGTPRLHDYGALYYASLVREVLTIAPFTSSVELVPPDDDNDLETILTSGVTSVIMSLEVWSDDVRARVCPGKVRVSRKRYEQAWRRALEILGPGTVSSVLLVGIEPLDATLDGIRALVGLGVLPTLIPFRPYENTPMAANAHTDTAAFLTVARYAAHELSMVGLTTETQTGCAACGGCSLEKLLLAADNTRPSANQTT